jgi:hypothetical protein
VYVVLGDVSLQTGDVAGARAFLDKAPSTMRISPARSGNRRRCGRRGRRLAKPVTSRRRPATSRRRSHWSRSVPRAACRWRRCFRPSAVSPRTSATSSAPAALHASAAHRREACSGHSCGRGVAVEPGCPCAGKGTARRRAASPQPCRRRLRGPGGAAPTSRDDPPFMPAMATRTELCSRSWWKWAADEGASRARTIACQSPAGGDGGARPRSHRGCARRSGARAQAGRCGPSRRGAEARRIECGQAAGRS